MDIGDEADPDYELEESDCTEVDHYPPEDEVGFPYIFFEFFRKRLRSYCSSGRLVVPSTARVTREKGLGRSAGRLEPSPWKP